MTTDERLERIESILKALHEFAVSRAESEVEFAKSLSETQGEILEALIALADAVDKLALADISHSSLESQHQHFKRVRDQ